MTLQLAHVTFDCGDVAAVAAFWSAVLDRPVDPEASEFFASISSPDASPPRWLFLKVPEPKTAKNRCHVDLHADSREAVGAEVARLTALGAAVIREPKEEWGTYWATLRDPEGNEFCIGSA